MFWTVLTVNSCLNIVKLQKLEDFQVANMWEISNFICSEESQEVETDPCPNMSLTVLKECVCLKVTYTRILYWCYRIRSIYIQISVVETILLNTSNYFFTSQNIIQCTTKWTLQFPMTDLLQDLSWGGGLRSCSSLPFVGGFCLLNVH